MKFNTFHKDKDKNNLDYNNMIWNVYEIFVWGVKSYIIAWDNMAI